MVNTKYSGKKCSEEKYQPKNLLPNIRTKYQKAQYAQHALIKKNHLRKMHDMSKCMNYKDI